MKNLGKKYSKYFVGYLQNPNDVTIVEQHVSRNMCPVGFKNR